MLSLFKYCDLAKFVWNEHRGKLNLSFVDWLDHVWIKKSWYNKLFYNLLEKKITNAWAIIIKIM